ncbi:MAG: histidine--tRNA ligase [Ruminococcaceae bacterium]|nr:histidine--tRNA ligase [Oscillospiraceae bacterium]
MMIQKPRGTMDILPEDVGVWQYIEETARKVSAKYGYSEIRFPTFESTELFARGVGDTTDVVQKEMYTFTDREDRSYTLRPEGTACVVRSLIENGRCSDTMPLKLYYIINCFRYEKPQAGRSREFFQFGTEMFGAAAPQADATVIALADSFIKELGIKDTKLHINSIGCPECRPKYHEALVKYFSDNQDKLCPTCKERLKTNPLRILDCKCPECKALAADAPKTIDNLCPECEEHFGGLKALLDNAGIKYEIDPHIVRGLDYYTRTVFEFICDSIGAQSTICGGGRYDGLMKQLGGPALPGIGFAMGITRLILALKASGVEINSDNAPSVYIAPMGQAASIRAFELVEKFREAGIYAETDLVSRSLKAQMKYADKTGAGYTVIIGDSELESGKAQLKDMKNSTQTETELDKIVDYILNEVR